MIRVSLYPFDNDLNDLELNYECQKNLSILETELGKLPIIKTLKYKIEAHENKFYWLPRKGMLPTAIKITHVSFEYYPKTSKKFSGKIASFLIGVDESGASKKILTSFDEAIKFTDSYLSRAKYVFLHFNNIINILYDNS